MYYNIHMDINIDLSYIIGFEWDKGNQDRNKLKHNVAQNESEEVFFNKPIFLENIKHSTKDEVRYYVLGRTLENRYLMISFCKRQNKIRVISARDQDKKEKELYNKLLNI